MKRFSKKGYYKKFTILNATFKIFESQFWEIFIYLILKMSLKK